MSGLSTPTPGSLREAVVELSGLYLHVMECGAGPRVVLLHGYTDSWRSFRLVLPQLARHGHCLAPDQRGHGASGDPGGPVTLDTLAGDVIEFLGRTGGPAALVGHSMGSFVARKVALSRPDLVDRLVLVGSGLRADNPVVRELEVLVNQFPAEVPRAFVEEFQAACVYRLGSVPGWFFDDCVAASAAVPLRVWRAALAGMLADDHTARLAEIAHPTLVVGGREDGIFGWQEQAALARALPRGRLLLYEDVGHSPHWEQPTRFAQDVVKFLGEPG